VKKLREIFIGVAITNFPPVVIDIESPLPTCNNRIWDRNIPQREMWYAGQCSMKYLAGKLVKFFSDQYQEILDKMTYHIIPINFGKKKPIV